MSEDNFILKNANLKKNEDFLNSQNLLNKMNGWFSPTENPWG